MTISSITVLICTYNRAPLLRETLAAMQDMTQPPDCAVEIVVVDNNSIDNTAAVVAHAGRRARYPVALLQERKQGKSFALNTGLSVARGDLLALTDDDVLPSPDWLVRMAEIFRDQHVTFAFGKVLPRWTCAPPPELLTVPAQDIWGPLAIVDYGNQPVRYEPNNTGQRLPIGANLVFLRSALLKIGGWRTDLGKVNNTLISGEDHEIFMRLRRHGLYSGYYDPGLSVRHYVPAARLTRKYFRRWFYWSGKTHALMLDELYPELNMAEVPRLAGVPRFAVRQGLAQMWRYLSSRRGDALIALIEELRLLQYIGLFVECWRHRKGKLRSLPRHVAVFAIALLAAAAPSSAAGRVRLTIADGRVWLRAEGATLEQILAEWQRVGGTRIDNPSSAPPAAVDLTLSGVSEGQALDILLRDTNVVIVGRTDDPPIGAQGSQIERIVLVPQRRAIGQLDATAKSTAAPPSQQRNPASLVQPIIGLNGLTVPDDQQDTPATHTR